MACVVVMLGSPGAGKGTQAKLLSEQIGVPHVSSGDLFRGHLSGGTELGLLAKRFMDAGGLVPDDVTVSMVMQRVDQPDCADGVILDGFPRTLPQAVALRDALAEGGRRVTVAPLVHVSDVEVVERLASRWTCKRCGAVYNVRTSPPAVLGVCDACGGELYQRDDDNRETVRNRLFTYYKETGPLVGYYFALGVLVEVDGEQAIDSVQKALADAVRSAASECRE
jgi:adenylate kinase